MRKTLVIMLIIFGFTNCKNEIKNTDENLIKKNHTPVFLSLSPSMSDKEFTNEIINLNDARKLNEGKFEIKTEENYFYFSVGKTKNTIRLSYSVISTISAKNISYELSDKYIEQDKKTVHQFIEIFESNYNGQKYKLPTNIDLTKYGLNKEHYNVYQDASKTVLFGYDIDEVRYPSPSELEIVIRNESFLDGLARESQTEDQRNRPCYFGYVILIDYYYNEDFEKLYKKIQSDSINSVQGELEKGKKEIERKKKLENNIRNNLKEL
ncbi:hypothetical protein ACM55H_02005 [Flavobacterium sp. ZT3R17]|uniref:hypothetical protein n=1 Tax=Flavobacterium cryoconiti TaxID=3398736 RepID=UPI003A843D40